MIYLTALYYSMAVLAIVYEGAIIGQAEKFMDFYTRMKDIPMDDRPSRFHFLNLMNILYRIWLIGGLFTSQWFIFLVILLMTFIPKKSVLLYRIDAILTFILLIGIVLNKQHLHLTLQSFLNF